MVALLKGSGEKKIGGIIPFALFEENYKSKPLFTKVALIEMVSCSLWTSVDRCSSTMADISRFENVRNSEPRVWPGVMGELTEQAHAVQSLSNDLDKVESSL